MTETTREYIIPIIKQYFSTKPMEKAWLFWSFARGEERQDSDIDILFSTIPNQYFSLLTYGGMYMDLKALLGREIDLVKEDYLLPFAVESANKDKILFYERAH